MLWKWNSLICPLLVAAAIFMTRVEASDDLVVDVVPNKYENGEIEEIEEIVVLHGARNVKVANRRVQFNPDDANQRQFEQHIFAHDGSMQKGREKAVMELQAAVRSLDAACRLSEFQKDKLTLAGQADQKRFFDRLEAVRTSSQSGQKFSGEQIAEVLSLRAKYETGLLSYDSFFAKTVRHALTADQLEDCRRHYLRALVEQTLRFVDRYVTLEAAQRTEIVTVLVEDCPSSFAFWSDGKSFKKLEVLQMNHRFSTLAETKIKPLVTVEQWQEIELWLEEFRRSHDALLFDEGRVVPGSNELVPAAAPALPRKKNQ